MCGINIKISRKQITYNIVFCLLLGLFLTSNNNVVYAATTVTSYIPGNTPTSKYSKYEQTFYLSRVFETGSMLPYYFYDPADNPQNFPGRNSPYGADGITVNGHFLAPGSNIDVVVPAFYYQDYTRTKNGSYSVLTAKNIYNWKVRYSPDKVGKYRFFLTIEDKNGLSRYPATGEQTFDVVDSASKGFVRVSTSDSRFLSYDDGSSFVPVGSGRQWWNAYNPNYERRSYYYESIFSDFKSNGINMTRIWDQNDGYALTVEGRYDQYSYPDDYNPEGRVDIASIPKGTQMNQRGNFEEDRIIDSAEKNNVYLILSSHGDPYWLWDKTVNSESWNTPVQMDDPEHIAYWKRNFRYRVARWGYSTSVLAWEAWNEHGHITASATSNLWNFYKIYGQYQKSIDPYRHLRTTSQGSQAYSPSFWSTNEVDIAQYHNYMMGWTEAAMRDDEANFVYRTGWCLGSKGMYCAGLGLGDTTKWVGADKPWIWGEIDVGTSQWDTPNPDVKSGEARVRMLHNTAWAGLFSPIGTTPLDWYYEDEDAATYALRLKERKILSDFFSKVTYDKSKFTYFMTFADAPVGVNSELATTSNSQARVYGMRSYTKDAYYLWVQNKDYTWKNFTTTPASVDTIVGISGMPSQSEYSLTLVDTHSGLKTTIPKVVPTNGEMKINITGLRNDIAIQIISLSLPQPSSTIRVSVTTIPTTIPTSTLSPTPSTAKITSTISPIPSPIVGNGDAKGQGLPITLEDVRVIFTKWFTSSGVPGDQYGDGIINGFDYSVVIANLLRVTPTPLPTVTVVATATRVPVTPNPTSVIPSANPTSTITPQSISGEWTQFGHDAGRTSYTAQSVTTPWKYKWQWNGAGTDGKKQAGHLNVPDMVQPITGGGRIYIVAENSLYALDKNNGSVMWSKGSLGTLSTTPVYLSEKIYLASGNNTLYKLDASTGNQLGTFVATSSLDLAPLQYGNYIYVVASNGILYKIDMNTMTKVWEYVGGSPGATTVSYASSKDLLIYVTQDLYVHSVVNSGGTRKWRIKPTVRNYTVLSAEMNLTEALAGWPVIAEQHGIVFIRYRLEWQTLWNGPDTNHTYPATNSDAKAYLTSNPKEQSLFALSLDNGSTAFIPNAGNGGAGDGGELPMGPQPMVRVVNGKEVAYLPFRNKLVCASESSCDSREDATMGEMVLDDTTVPGYLAGDMRFVAWRNLQNPTLYYHDMQTDEMMYVTGSGSTLFHSHWLTAEAYTITDRSDALGSTYLAPIKTVHAPNIIWRQVYCAPTNTNCNPQIFPGGSGYSWGPSTCQFNATSRYCKDGLYGYGDQRGYPSGFYEYHNDNNIGSTPLVTSSTPFVIVSNGQVIVKTNDGAIMALENGSPTASTNTNSVAVVSQKTSLKNVLAASSQKINWKDASKYINKNVTVEGVITSAVDHRPKAIYLGFKNPHDGGLLIRVFEKNIDNFKYNLMTLNNRKVRVTGFVTLYWPEGKDPEIIVTDPKQIQILE